MFTTETFKLASLKSISPLSSPIQSICGFVFVYITTLCVYRLYFAPAAKFPGPRLAALTFFYEGYFDAWCKGQYTWKIKQLHKQYGPFVRINPFEVHCSDSAFFDTLYVNSAKRRTNKWFWAIRQSWTRDSAFKTLEHDLHKQRRSQLSPFFSKSSVRSLESLIVREIDQLCIRLEQKCSSGRPVVLTYAFVALTLDIISRLCFGFSYNFLQQDDFAREWYKAMVSVSVTAHVVRQFPWLFHLMSRFPRLAQGNTASSMLDVERRRQTLIENVKEAIELHSQDDKPATDGFTIFHSMLDADVPPQEKSAKRLVEEAHTLTGAGSMTTSTALEAIFYHLVRNPAHMRRLTQELALEIPNPALVPTVVELEKLPFLTAVIHEGLRLGKSVTHRLARVSPDEDYTYGDIVIPRGVPVSMTMMNMLEDPVAFPGPDTFKPDRWLSLDATEARKRVRAVFGGGTRGCLGMNLAWTELYLVVAVLIRRFGMRMSLHEVVFERDIKITVDAFNALPSKDSKGLRVIVHEDDFHP